MFLFRPSNNNQRYAFVPLLDQSDNDDDEFADGDEEKGGKRIKNKTHSLLFYSGENNNLFRLVMHTYYCFIRINNHSVR
jgi:hypothetical protein